MEEFEEWVSNNTFDLPYWWDNEGGAAETIWNHQQNKISRLVECLEYSTRALLSNSCYGEVERVRTVIGECLKELKGE